MLHAKDSEQAIEGIHRHVGIALHKGVNRLIVVQRVTSTDQVLRPPNVVNELASMAFERA